MSQARKLTAAEVARFVETSDIFDFNSNQFAEHVTNKPVARRRMLAFLNRHPGLAEFISDADEKFRQLFAGKRLEMKAMHHYQVYRGQGPEPLRLDNEAMGTLFLTGFLDMYGDQYRASAAGQEFDSWVAANKHRSPADFHVSPSVYM